MKHMTRFRLATAVIAASLLRGEGDGSEDLPLTLTAQELQAKIDEAVGGLKGKNKELLDAQKAMKDQLKAWEGLDPSQVRNFMDKLGADEELRLIAEGKHEDAWQKRLEKVGAQHKSQLEGVAAERDTYRTEKEQLAQQVRDLIIDQQIVTTFIGEKGFDYAIPDIVLRAKKAFTIEDGVPIARDDKGEIIRGKEGPITIKEWVAARRVDCPHWFPESSGAGAGGSRKGGGSGGDLDSRMAAAADAGDMDTYKRLKREKQELARKGG
jgi:hypothetical protein